eukprot:Em0018g247a
MDTVKLHVYSSSSEIQNQLCDFIAAAAHKAAHDHGHFSVGLSGGSVATMVSQGLRGRKDIDWSKWHVLYCDERHVPFTSEDSTHAYIKKELLDHVEVPENNIYTIDPSLDVSEAAEDYIAKLRKLYPGEDHPSFDLLLAGYWSGRAHVLALPGSSGPAREDPVSRPDPRQSQATAHADHAHVPGSQPRQNGGRRSDGERQGGRRQRLSGARERGQDPTRGTS